MADTHKVYLPLINTGVVSKEPVPAPTPKPKPPSMIPEQALQLATEINIARVAHNLSVLLVDGQLSAAAQEHSEDMAARSYFSHDTLDGWSWYERIRRHYSGGVVGECIAAGYKLPSSVVTGWLESPGHRAIILEEGDMPKWTCMGLGYAHGGLYTHYYVLDVGGI